MEEREREWVMDEGLDSVFKTRDDKHDCDSDEGEKRFKRTEREREKLEMKMKEFLDFLSLLECNGIF